MLGCAENDGTDTKSFVNDSGAGGVYYLVRGVTFACGHGTYDDGSSSQAGSRDAEIAASGNGCP